MIAARLHRDEAFHLVQQSGRRDCRSAVVSKTDLIYLRHRPEAVRVELDVVPGSGATVKLGKGSVAVALLGSRWFQAGEIDPGTLTLGNDNGIETPVARKKGIPVARLTDSNRDGFVDLVVEFDKQAMARSGDLVAGAQTLILQGGLRGGIRVRGADVVTGVR